MHIQRKRVLKHHPRFYGRVVFYIALLLLPIMVNNAFYRQNASNVAGFAFTFQPHRQITNSNVAGATTTFTRGIIPFSEQEIGNPMRGPEYYGGEQSPLISPLSSMECGSVGKISNHLRAIIIFHLLTMVQQLRKHMVEHLGGVLCPLMAVVIIVYPII